MQRFDPATVPHGETVSEMEECKDGMYVLARDAADLQASLERAERALRAAGFSDEGGADWKPPLGKQPVARVFDRDTVGVGGSAHDVEILDRARYRDGMYLYDGAFHSSAPLPVTPRVDAQGGAPC